MWANFDHASYDRAGFVARVASLRWTDWRPQGIVLHNTGAPTLSQWAESGPAHDQRIANLERYYQGLGWHAGPHFFVSRQHVSGFSNPLEPGVHSTCWNRTHLGIEMVGDYSSEAFDSGDGSQVRDMSIFALSTLYPALHLDPHGLVFHRQCVADHHACPGSNVDQNTMIARVVAALG